MQALAGRRGLPGAFLRLAARSARQVPDRRHPRPAAHSAAADLGLQPHNGGCSASVTVAPLKFHLRQEVEELGRSSGPLAVFEALVAGGELREDAEQRRVLEYLSAVFHGAPKRTARGLYLHGSVGCGKTMAMDLFFSALQGAPGGLRVLRRHFHDFLHDVQLRLHRLKKERRPGAAPEGHPVELVGRQIAGEVDVLCFDEFAITTIQDCVLLMPLFSMLFQEGVTVVATSNRAPEELYSDGLNRHLYLPPFLDVLRRHCRVHQLQSSTDYRVLQHESCGDAGVFCWPQDRGFIDHWFQQTTDGAGGQAGSVDVSFGRRLQVPQLSGCGRVGRFSFDELCRGQLSADDYLRLCGQLHTILLDDVPCLAVDEHNEARRFTMLIDSCYERHVRLICSMAGPPEALLGGLSELQNVSLSGLGGPRAGCGDGDTAPSSSGVLQAIERIKASRAARSAALGIGDSSASTSSSPPNATLEQTTTLDVLGAEFERVRAHGSSDVDVWRQSEGDGLAAPPQVSRAWDDRRRISQFTWEAADPTAEQQSIKGVFAAAVASLKESGFAVERAISRLREMQTTAFQQHHHHKHLTAA